MLKFKNSYKAWHLRQTDKFELKLRIAKIDVISLRMDLSSKRFEFILFNIGITNY